MLTGYFSPFTRANPHSSLLTPTPTTPWFPLFFPRVLRIAPYSQLYRCHTPQSPDLPRPLLKTQCKLHIFYLISDLHPAPAFQDAPPLPPSTQAKCSRPPSPSPAPRHRALAPSPSLHLLHAYFLHLLFDSPHLYLLFTTPAGSFPNHS